MIDFIDGVVSVVNSVENAFVVLDSLQLHDDSFCIFVTVKRNPSSIKIRLSFLSLWRI